MAYSSRSPHLPRVNARCDTRQCIRATCCAPALSGFCVAVHCCKLATRIYRCCHGARLMASTLAVVANIDGTDAVAGVSTFNDFGTQSTVACAGFAPTNSQGNNVFAAAMSDLSPLREGAVCGGALDASKCDGRGACVDCIGPACPDEERCGSCFNVRCASPPCSRNRMSIIGRCTVDVDFLDCFVFNRHGFARRRDLGRVHGAHGQSEDRRRLPGDAPGELLQDPRVWREHPAYRGVRAAGRERARHRDDGAGRAFHFPRQPEHRHRARCLLNVERLA